MSKIASLSQEIDCFKLTVKQRELQNERSGRGEKQDCSCGHSVFAVCCHCNAPWLLVEFRGEAAVRQNVWVQDLRAGVSLRGAQDWETLIEVYTAAQQPFPGGVLV